ncbi:BREX-1 system adenine-specific DNA-methyltransferase PglX [Gordonia alkaliphila]|uniref:BREX-1 system adenine-specific DNA-methyltransferase PglX n=1 Tax=Gordonia alkaliphila TaxID=1053547 RepID=UPI001FF391B8|nr:BREX-1 system adenine-specific DNA-methyltransferase PglX [Gordonia alkaliphila]MCK0438161.1 BREX-1 system adenine-specific DNA-methyltransferase PglX [Gordonia alkaliphila]
MKDEFPDVKQDLYGAFVVRGIELAHDAGLLAIVIGDTWMSIKSFEALRLRLLNGHAFGSFVHMRDVSNHPDIFGANAAFVLSMAGNRSRRAPFIRLTPLGSDRKEHDLRIALAQRTEGTGFHLASGADFAAIPGSPIVYWLSEKMRAAFATGTPLGHVAAPRKGIDTGENAEFLRMWWEVSCRQLAVDGAHQGKWLPYNKGGGFRRWYGNRDVVVNWEFDGAAIRARKDWASRKPTLRNLDFMKREGFSWGTVSSGGFSARYTPPGALFDNGGCTLFADQGLGRLGAFLNSTANDLFLGFLAPTLNFQPGDIALVPLAPGLNTLDIEAAECIQNARDDYDSFEDSWDFSWNPLVRRACDSASRLD